MAAPSLDDFLSYARQDNPGVSDGALAAYWLRKYGSGGASASGMPKPEATAGGLIRSFGASAIDTIGSAMQGGGEVLAAGWNAVTGSQDARAVNPLKAVTDPIRAGMSTGDKLAARDTFGGDILDPSTYELPKTGAGWAHAIASGFGSLSSMILPGAMAATGARGMIAAGAVTGALTTGGAAAGEVRESIGRAMENKTADELAATIPAYREARAAGLDDGAARDKVQNDSAILATALAGAAGAAGGAFNAKVLEDVVAKRGLATLLGRVAKTRAGQIGVGASVGVAAEGLQEGLEKVGQNVGENLGTGRPAFQDATRDTVGDVIIGGMIGGVTGGAAGAVTRREPDPRAETRQAIEDIARAPDADAAIDAFNRATAPSQADLPPIEFDRLGALGALYSAPNPPPELVGPEHPLGDPNAIPYDYSMQQGRFPALPSPTSETGSGVFVNDTDPELTRTERFGDREARINATQRMREEEADGLGVRDIVQTPEGPRRRVRVTLDEEGNVLDAPEEHRSFLSLTRREARPHAAAAIEAHNINPGLVEAILAAPSAGARDEQAVFEAIRNGTVDSPDVQAVLARHGIQPNVNREGAQPGAAAAPGPIPNAASPAGQGGGNAGDGRGGAAPNAAATLDNRRAGLEPFLIRGKMPREHKTGMLAIIAKNSKRMAERAAARAELARRREEGAYDSAAREARLKLWRMIRKAGGIHLEEAPDIGIEPRSLRGYRASGLFSPSGMRADALAALLVESGYLNQSGEVETNLDDAAREVVADLLAGEFVGSHEDWARMAPIMGANHAAALLEAEVAPLPEVDRQDVADYDDSVILEAVEEFDVALDAQPNMTVADAMRLLGFTEEEISNAERSTPEQRAEVAEEVVGDEPGGPDGSSENGSRQVERGQGQDGEGDQEGETEVVEASPTEVDAAAHEAATSPQNDLPEPTEEQKKAGNYAKGHVSIAGLDVSIENPAGSKRRPEWPTLQSHYGYFKRTEGNDGDHVDTFIRPGTPTDYDGPVFVVDQVDPKTGRFDEHKVMVGWPDEAAARAAYLENYTPDWKGLRAITRMDMDEFKAWLRDGDTTKPAAKAKTEAKLRGRRSVAPKPKFANMVIRQVRDRHGEMLGTVMEPYDGTVEDARRAAEAVTKRMYYEYPNAGNVASRIGATDENGNPKWAISPNFAHINPIDSVEGRATFGDDEAIQQLFAPRAEIDVTPQTAAPTPAPQKPGGDTDATLSRFKPKEMVVFEKPFIGKTGAKLTGYQWVWTKIAEVDKRGEDRVIRISDWERAMVNPETNREIVHQFQVVTTDGELHVVSAESAAKMLGVAQSTVRSNAVKLVEQQIREQEEADRRTREADQYDAMKAMPTPAQAIEGGDIGYAELVRRRALKEGKTWGAVADRYERDIMAGRQYRFLEREGKFIFSPEFVVAGTEMARRGWKTVELKAREIWDEAGNDRRQDDAAPPDGIKRTPTSTANNVSSAIKSAANGTELVNWIARNSKNPVYRAIARRISLFVRKPEVVVVTSGKEVPGGVPSSLGISTGVFYENFRTGRRAIFLKDESFAENGMNEETALHELVHAATNERIRVGNLTAHAGTELGKAVADLYALQKSVVAELNRRHEAGTLSEFEGKLHIQMAASSVKELVAWGLTDAEFQAMLRSIRVENSSGWSRFVRALRKILGLDAGSETALGELLSVTDRILSADLPGNGSGTVDAISEESQMASRSMRAGSSEMVGDYLVRTFSDGAIFVKGDVADIRALLPDGVLGRPAQGGVVFSHTAAHRVKSAIAGQGLTYSRGGKVLGKMPVKDGKYIGAPAKFDTPAKIPHLRKWLRRLAQEGAPGRFWYENSSREILAMVGGDVQEARRFVALLAIYSPQAKVDANSTFALRAWAQYKAGQPISVKTGVMDAKAQAALDNIDEFWSGEKTGNFFHNLLSEIDPATRGRQGATIDMWMMRAAQYDTDAPTVTQYAFMENETNRLAAELGWDPQQVQAAIWVAMKSRMENAGVKAETERTSARRKWIRFEYPIKNGRRIKTRVVLDAQKHRNNWLRHALAHNPTGADIGAAKFDFSDGVRRHIGLVSWDAMPSLMTGLLPGVRTAPREQQIEFQRAIQRALYDENGNDLLAMRLGLLADNQGDVGTQTQAIMAPAKGDDGKSRIDPDQKQLLDAYSATLGLLLQTDAVGYHRPFYAGRAMDANAVELRIGRPFSHDQASDLWMALEVMALDKGIDNPAGVIGVIPSKDGVRVVNFGALEDNREFQAMVDEAATHVQHEGRIDPIYFGADGGLVTNDWSEDQNGEGFERQIGAAGRSDVLGWARSVLAPRIHAVFKDFSVRYDWGSPGPEVGSGVAEDGGGKRGDESRSLATGDVNEPEAPYTTDLFGDSFELSAVSGAPRAARPARTAGAGLSRDAQPGAPLSDTEVPPGEYLANTTVVATVQRQLGATRIRNAADLAAATRYLYRSAVERFDAIVTDADGRPLAVVGSFKGALTQTSVYPATVVAEAIRVPGAAQIWFSHNHPSGTADLSMADRMLHGAMIDAFRGSGIEPMDLIAVAGSRFAGQDGGRNYLGPADIPASIGSVNVPVIERELDPGFNPGLALSLSSPALAKAMAVNVYGRNQGPGLMLLDARNRFVAWVPLDAALATRLRGSGGLAAVYRAISQSNAASAILVHGGEYAARTQGIPLFANIGAALKQADVSPLDSINVKGIRGAPESAAEQGLSLAEGPVFSRGRPPAYMRQDDYRFTKRADSRGMPAFVSKAIVLAHAREKDALGVPAGGKAMAFSIFDRAMPINGKAGKVGDVLVHVDARGNFASLRNIEIAEKFRDRGLGEGVILGMLQHNGNVQMEVYNIQSAAKGDEDDALPFWKKIGTNILNNSSDPDVVIEGRIGLDDYLKAAGKRSRLRSNYETDRPANSRREPSTARGDEARAGEADAGGNGGREALRRGERRPAGAVARRSIDEAPPRAGLSVSAIESEVARLTAGWANAPGVTVLATPADAPFEAPDDANGALWRGRVYLFASNLRRVDEAEFVLFHESLGHLGLRGAFGADLDATLRHIFLSNKNVRVAAGRWTASYGEDAVAQRVQAGMPAADARRAVQMLAIEEALADMAGKGERLSGLKRLVAALQDVLRRLGMTRVADWLEGATDAEVGRMLAATREFVEDGDRAQAARIGELAGIYSQRPAPFYSALARAVAADPARAMTADGWGQRIKSWTAKGIVKADELQWTGLEEWLRAQEGKITRDAVQAFLDAGGVRVETSVMGDSRDDVLDIRTDMDRRLRAIGYSIDFDPATDEVIYVKVDEDGDPLDDDLEYNDLPDEARAIIDEGLNLETMAAVSDAKYSNWTLPGGEDYREVLLTLPTPSKPTFVDVPSGRGPYEVRQSDGKWYIVDRYGEWGEVGYEDRGAAEAQIPAPQTTQIKRDLGALFESMHWDEPNVLAHFRADVVTGADGKRYLRVFEIQSDWAQKGRKEGFKAEPRQVWRVLNRHGVQIGAADTEADARYHMGEIAEQAEETVESLGLRIELGADTSKVVTAIPAAPFVDKTEAWVGLAIKRAIRMAADEGLDGVVFSTGEQMVDLFDLSKQVSRVQFDDNASGGIGPPNMDGPTRGGTLTVLGLTGNEVIKRQVANEQEIADLVGKDVARKLLEQPAKQARHVGLGVRRRMLEGLDLKIGGEGMLAFYDKIVPGVARDVAKKLGGAMEAIPVERESHQGLPFVVERENGGIAGRPGFPTRAEAQAWIDGQPRHIQRELSITEVPVSTQPGFLLSDAMRAKAMQGLPLFSRDSLRDRQVNSPEFKKWFGDSKVVDAEGRPLVVYHSTQKAGFDVFWPESHFGNIGQANAIADTKRRVRDSFMALPGKAGKFHRENIESGQSLEFGANDAVYPVYLSITNPKRVADAYDTVGWADTIAQAKAEGYDGIVYRNDVEGEGDSWIAFRPNQIKSATGNTGAFDARDDRVVFSRGLFDASVSGSSTPAETRSRLDSTKDSLRAAALGAFTRRQLAEMYGRDMPEVARYDELHSSMDAQRSNLAQEADLVLQAWRKLPKDKADALADLMHEATLAQYDPDTGKEGEGFGLPKAEAAGMKQRFKDLGESAQAVYRQARGMYADRLRILFEALEARIARAGTDPEATKKTIDQLRLLYDQHLRKGPYFPLARFGDYLLIAERKEPNGQDDDRMVMSFETAVQRDRQAAMMRAKGFRVKTTVSKEYSRSRDGSAGPLAEAMSEAIGKLEFDQLSLTDGQGRSMGDLKSQLLDDLNQAFIRGLPELSYRKHFMHRKGTPGFSGDAMRAFADSMLHASNQIARMGHADQMVRALDQMQEGIAGESEGDLTTRQQVLNEMVKRHEVAMTHVTHPVAAMLGQLGFVMSLGASVASGVVNLTQTPLVTLPYLASRFGWDQASKALALATKRYATSPWVMESGFNAAKNATLSQDQRDMLAQLEDAGKINTTLAHDLAGASTADNLSQFSKYGSGWQRIMRAVGWTFHVPEVANRQITALATYDLARQAGKSHAQAVADAGQAIDRTHFDYTAGNRARYLEGNFRRVITMFKQYGQNIAFLYGRAAYQALKGATPAERREAKRLIYGMVGLQFAAAGALGLPFVGTVASVFAGLANGFRDDDEEFDWEVEFRKWLASVVGKDAGEAIAKGLPRLVVGWDIAGRIGQNDLFVRSPNKEQEGRDAYFAWLQALAGPVAGYALNGYLGMGDMLSGAKNMDGGRFMRGVEEMLPAALKNPLKAIRYEGEGVRTRAGHKQLEPSAFEVVGQALGFTPSRVAEMYEGVTAVKNAEHRIVQRRNDLLDMYAKGRRDQDQTRLDRTRAEILEFNARHPTMRITGETLLKSSQGRAKRQAGMQDGMYLPRSREFLRQEGAFANL